MLSIGINTSMPNVIFQFYVPPNDVGKLAHYRGLTAAPEWGLRSVHYFRHYAERNGASHFFHQKRYVNSISNYFEKCRIYLDPFFDTFDKLLYVDIDVMPKDMNRNIFEVECVDVAGVEEQNHPAYKNNISWSKSEIQRRFSAFNAPVVSANHNSGWPRMINSGVMLWSREARIKAREKFEDFDKWFQFKNKILDDSVGKEWGHSSHCLDQPFFNAMFNKYKFKVNTLPIEWNRFPCKDEDYPCVFAHYTQDTRYSIPERFPEL
jgi:lipopolysaccharide biosynthesis glycosyltransferase